MENSGDTQKVTDLAYLVKLSKGNEQFVKDMIKIFLEENPGEIEMLEKAVKERNFSLINSTAHKLRSTVPFVGIDKVISKEISEIEELAVDQAGNPLDIKSPDPARKSRFLPNDRELLDKIDSLFARIKKICGKANEELKVYMR